MATVATGARLTLRCADRTIGLRALAEVPVSQLWSIPVLAVAAGQLDGLAGELEVPTDRGLLRLAAHLVSDGHALTVQPGHGVPMQIQRRDDVRAEVRLPVRAVLDQIRLRPASEPVVSAYDGSTVNLSAGGIGVRLDVRPDGGRLYAELDLPDGRLVPAVLTVVEVGTALLRARFVEIDPVDRERLVRLVFEQQRRELAARKRLTEVWPQPDQE
jgi:PilZ domain